MDTRNDTASGSTYDPSVQTPPAEQASVAEDFLDIFYAPSSVFARRATGGFWLHLLVVSVLAAGFAFANSSVIQQVFDVEFSRSMAEARAENPRMTDDDIATARNFSAMAATIGSYIGTPIIIFVLGVITWGAARLAGVKITAGVAVLIVTLAWIPRLVQSALITVQMLLMETSAITSMHSISLSPARFMDPDATGKTLLAFAGRFDVFVLWTTILIAVGIAAIAKVPKERAALAAGIVWLVGTLPLLL